MSQFEELLNKAKNEPRPLRILILFAKATNMFEGGQQSYSSGTIEPIMCVDKRPEELTTFKALVEEADSHTKKWNFILVSSLSGTNNTEPTDKEVDSALHKMSNGLASGEDLSQYIVWNRQEELVVIS